MRQILKEIQDGDLRARVGSPKNRAGQENFLRNARPNRRTRRSEHVGPASCARTWTGSSPPSSVGPPGARLPVLAPAAHRRRARRVRAVARALSNRSLARRPPSGLRGSARVFASPELPWLPDGGRIALRPATRDWYVVDDWAALGVPSRRRLSRAGHVTAPRCDSRRHTGAGNRRGLSPARGQRAARRRRVVAVVGSRRHPATNGCRSESSSRTAFTPRRDGPVAPLAWCSARPPEYCVARRLCAGRRRERRVLPSGLDRAGRSRANSCGAA